MMHSFSFTRFTEITVVSCLFLFSLTSCHQNTLTTAENKEAVNLFISKYASLEASLCREYYLGQSKEDGFFSASKEDCDAMTEKLVKAAQQDSMFPGVTAEDFKDVQVWKNYDEFTQRKPPLSAKG